MHSFLRITAESLVKNWRSFDFKLFCEAVFCSFIRRKINFGLGLFYTFQFYNVRIRCLSFGSLSYHDLIFFCYFVPFEIGYKQGVYILIKRYPV